MIEFLLHNEKITLTDIDPNTTVLKYLREQRRKMGTKEGCASGDCGACTVVLAQLAPSAAHSSENATLEYKSVNACITFISALHHKQLICVDDLKQTSLHSCQQAMVDKDGSQCGFCTPGFVMSLFALQKNNTSYDRHKTQQALAGNLCRCTGYQAIDNAAQQSFSQKVPDHFDRQQQQTITQLKAMNASRKSQSISATRLLNDGNPIATCHLPQSVDELCALLIEYPKSQLIAGGTDLSIGITQHGSSYQSLIDLKQIAALSQYTISENHIEIGAMVTLAQCQQLLMPYFADFSLLLERFASLQVRNQGTLAGNIANASPIGDSPPALIALDARLLLRKGESSREVKLDQFFTDYKKTRLSESEFIEKIIIPLPAQRSVSAHSAQAFFKVHKVSKRQDDDISAICAAYALDIDSDNKISHIRLAYGGMAAIAKRALATERALLGKAFNEQTFSEAKLMLTDDFQPMSDHRASSEYRLLLAQNLLQKLYIEISADLQQTKQLDSEQANKAHTRIFDYV